MENQHLTPLMIALALATPALGLVLHYAARAIARDSGEPPTPVIRRATIILYVAGPLNLLIWVALNQWLNAVGYRSVLGYALPAAAFFLVGWATGFFARMRARLKRSNAYSAPNSR